MCENFFTPESSLTRTTEISPRLTRGLRVPLKRSPGRNPLLFLSKVFQKKEISGTLLRRIRLSQLYSFLRFPRRVQIDT